MDINHCGYIVKVKELRAHPNADKLYIATFFGNDTCVSIDTQVGDIGVYFPCDLQLSLEFCIANHLCRKLPDGTADTGYMEVDKRNITAIRLRGERSDGLYLPIKCFDYCYNDDASAYLKVGDIINEVNGHPICNKYIPRTNKQNKTNSSNVSKTRKHKDPIAPLFKEHVDTAQLAYNLNAFKPGDLIEITRKLHGCFVAGTKVRMADGSLKEIQRIRIGDEVLGYNFNTKKIESTKVLHTFKNAPSSKWNQLKFSRNGAPGDKRGTQTSTYNHRYWVEEENKWIMAQDLKVGQIISTLIPSPVLTTLQKEICIGQILGDGCLLTYNNRTANIEESKKEEHREYLEYISKISSNFFYISNYERISGYGTKMVNGKTHRSADLYNYLKNYSTFNNDTNAIRLKPDIVNAVSPLSLAIWYMGDGSLAYNEFQQDRANFAICRYTQEEDREIIKNIFLKFNITPSFYQDNEGYWRIRLNKDEAIKLFELIAPYIPPIMSYKLSEKYRNKFNPPIEDEVYNPNGYVLSPQTVLENIPIEKEYDEYDLETELHNYVVGLTIVHNTSARIGYLPVLKGYKRTLWDKITHKDGTPIYEYDYIDGTRRTLLTNYDGGFYGSNEFRKHFHEAIEGKLHKGESIYAEIVGFTDDGVPIMGSVSNKKTNDKAFIKQYGDITTFSYGCRPGQLGSLIKDKEVVDNQAIVYPVSDFYVYRMTLTTPEGYVVEYSPEYTRYRCEQMGVKFVPVEWRGYIPEHPASENDDTITAGEWIMNKAEQYYDGPEPIDPRHVREGVVVRLVDKPSFTAYKHKNFSFKLISGIAVADTTPVDETIAEEL